MVSGGHVSHSGLEVVDVPVGGRGILRSTHLSLSAGHAVSGLSGPFVLPEPFPFVQPLLRGSVFYLGLDDLRV